MNVPHGSQAHINSLDEYPISKQILCHSGLLTPILRDRFGDIYVEEVEACESTDIYFRRSSIRQVSTGNPLVIAELKVRKVAVSEALLMDLRQTTLPFGQLLINNGVEVRLMKQRFFVELDEGGHSYLGRCHAIYQVVEGQCRELVCEVKERLLDESSLKRLQRL